MLERLAQVDPEVSGLRTGSSMASHVPRSAEGLVECRKRHLGGCRLGNASTESLADQPVAAGCRKPSPHPGRLCPRLGGASLGFVTDSEELSREPGMPMETMLSELVLVALLLAVVVVLGKV